MENKFLVHNDKIRNDMLSEISMKSFDDLFDAIKSDIRLKNDLNLPDRCSEIEVKNKLIKLAKLNKTALENEYFLGGGAYNKFIPEAISYLTQRSEFLTAYTPYQPEISQGSLQSIYEYQTMICNITGMDVSNAGVYDGGTACAEAILMACRIKKKNKVLVASTVNPEYLQVIKTYANAGNVEVVVINASDTTIKSDLLTNESDYAAVLIQYPNYFGDIEDLEEISKFIKANDALFICCCEPSSLFVLKSPSEYDADIVVGDIQTLGLPLAASGPYAGYIATKSAYMRQLAGRIVGLTKDKEDKIAFTLTQQAREQHIRRDKATSNICSNQALMTLRATIFMALLGFDGICELENISIQNAQLFVAKICELDGFKLLNKNFLNEFVIQFPQNIKVTEFLKFMERHNVFAGINLENKFKYMKNCLLIATTELNTKDNINNYIELIKQFMNNI